MSKYISADKLIAEINALKEKYGSCVAKNEVEKCYKGGRLIGYDDTLYKIDKLQQEQPDQSECVWIHKKYNREYRIVSDNARLKNSNGEWIDCVIYAPLYENEFEMFAREKDSFYKEFEKK